MIPASNETETEWSALVAQASPLFKWAGGKQRFLWGHRDRIPMFDGRYIEPFAGGLAVLFHVARRSQKPVLAIASDTNLRLIRCYQEVGRDWQGVADRLSQIYAAYRAASDKSAFYFQLREEYNRFGPSAGAARFIFLMTAGWNGVYRVNQKGHFNVPHGVVKDALPVPSSEALRAVATVLQHTQLRATSWESTVAVAKPGDFVFLDPPYYSDNRTQLYGRAMNAFGYDEHVKLADALVGLAERGTDFVLTNSGHEAMRNLYEARGLRVESIEMHRSISSNGLSRGADSELVVTPRDARSTRRAEAELALRVRVSRNPGDEDHP